MDPNAADADGTRPLRAAVLCGAAGWGYEDTVRALLVGGADPNQAERDGMLPLAWATHGGHHGTAAALREALGIRA